MFRDVLREWPFSLLAVVVLTWALLTGPWTLFVVCFLALLAFKVAWDLAVYGLFKVPRSRAMVRTLEEGGITRFLEEIEKDIQKENNRVWRDMLLVNKAAGLYYRGAFDEGLGLLEKIDPRRFPRTFKVLYHVNRLAFLLAQERIPEAREWVEENAKMFRLPDRPERLRAVIRANLAVLMYHEGRIEESRGVLEELSQDSRPAIYRAGSTYVLGCIAMKEGKVDEARQRFRQAIAQGAGTFFVRKAEEKLFQLG